MGYLRVGLGLVETAEAVVQVRRSLCAAHSFIQQIIFTCLHVAVTMLSVGDEKVETSLLCKPAVLVSSGCHDKIAQTGWCKQQKFITVLRVEVQFNSWGKLLAFGQLPSLCSLLLCSCVDFLLYVHFVGKGGDRVRSLSSFSFFWPCDLRDLSSRTSN